MGAQPRAPQTAAAYRPEIDGLRAVAVLAVILFHARIAGFGGGFIGVDVFFVISGFLITSLILHDKQAGTFSLARFWARRARRILPALFTMLALVSVPAWQLLTMAQRADFIRTLAGAALSVSNVRLAFTTGYFDTPADERPLLHTWSLGVEEQFYLLFPLAVAGLWRWGRARLAAALTVAALASLALAEAGWRHHPGPNFFLAPSRAWELLLGALAAFAHAARDGAAFWPSPRWRAILAGAGLAAVLGSMAAFDRSTPSPSLLCLVPVAGTGAVLLFAERGCWTARLLSVRLLVAIGLVSYSAYLWHQPLLVLGRLAGVGTHGLGLAGTIAATFAIAALSWRCVEQPARRAAGWSTARVLGVAAASCAALGISGAATAMLAGAPVPAAVQRAFEPVARVEECMDLPTAGGADGWFCTVNAAAKAPPSFIVYGDSHAMQLLPAFEEAAARHGRSGILSSRSGCAPLPGTVALTHPPPMRAECAALASRVFAYAREHGIRDVFLVGKWSYYTELSFGGMYLNALGLDESDAQSLAVSRLALARGALNAAQSARASGVRLRVVLQLPWQPVPPARLYEDAWKAGGNIDRHLRAGSATREQHRQKQAAANAAWRAVPGITLLDFTDQFCDSTACPVGTASRSLYQDNSHVSAYGARLLVPRLAEQLRAPR